MRIALFNDTSAHNHSGCYAVCSVIVNELAKLGHAPSFFWPVAQDWRRYKQEIKEENFDLVICNGEGTIHDSGNSASSLCELGKFCNRVLRVKCFLINASIFNIPAEMAENLKYYDAIYARESYTVKYLKTFGIHSKAIPDLSFFVDIPPASDNNSKQKDAIVILDSVRHSDSVALRLFASSLKDCEFVKLDRSAKNNKRVLARINNRIDEIAIKSFNRFGIRYGSFKYHNICRPNWFGSKFESDFFSFIRILRCSRGVLTGRFHGLTLSLLMRKPVVAIQSNTPKSEVLLKDIFGSSNRVLPIDQAMQIAGSDQIPSLNSHELQSLEFYLESGRASMLEIFRTMLASV